MTRHFSAGGVVFKRVGDKVFFLIRRNNTNGDFYRSSNWSLPKGWLDDDPDGGPGSKTLGKTKATEDEIKQTAIREVFEETGVNARISSKLGTIQFFFYNEKKERILKFVTFYLMECVNEIEHGYGPETAEIRWVSIEEAIQLLSKRKSEIDLLIKAVKIA